MKNNERSTLGFASRTLKSTETRYTTTEIEALALVYCCTKFRQYLIGDKVIIETDHHKLTFIKQCRLTNGRLTRWALALQEFDLTLKFIPGRENIAADVLSRYPRVGENIMEQKTSINKINTNTISKELIKKIRNANRIHEKEPHRKYSDNIKTVDGITFAKNKLTNRWKIVIPGHLTSQLIREMHMTFNHPGRDRTWHMINESCAFKNMKRTIAEIIKTCETCQKTKPLNYSNKGSTRSHKPSRILEKVSINLMGLLPTSRGGIHYILAILDVFSKYIKLYALKRATTRTILEKILQTILSDNRTQLTSKSWTEFMEKENIKTAFTSRYHPQANPVERYN